MTVQPSPHHVATPRSELSLAGQVGAHKSWANTPDRTARTAPARAALDAKFLEQADGDPVRAAHLRKAWFASLALKSAQARRKARELTAQAESAERELADAGAAASVNREGQGQAGGEA